ncbi:hypothetical protein Tco_1019136 [Tanacetum coccineum]|uniref:Uncharacterized protein n=1 Tax=Tanacetum coccineum TaxID=301880 RepID=A0ABQ5FW91_9ASTR
MFIVKNALPQPEVMKAELLKLDLHDERNVKEQASVVIQNPFIESWRLLMTFVIQVLGRNKSSTDQLNLS